MTIGLITPYFPDEHTKNSGIANHFSILAAELHKLGHKIIIVHVRPAYDNESDELEKIVIEGETIITQKIFLSKLIRKLTKNYWTITDVLLKIKAILITPMLIRSIQKEYKIDIIETTSYLSLCFLVRLLNPKIPIVTRVSTTFLQILNDHNTFKSTLLFWFGRLEIFEIKNCTNPITHAKKHALELEKLYGVDSSKIKIIPHGVTLPMIKYTSPKDSNIKILYVGRLEFRKGSDILMESIPMVLEQCSNVRFEIIGFDPNGSYERELKNHEYKALDEAVIFRGIQNNGFVSSAYESCDIFVAPSRYESFGLIYIEAMSYAKPVIGCEVGGIAEIIEDGFNGLFAQGNNPRSLADKIISLVIDESLRQEMGLNGRKTVEDKFSGKQLAVSSIEYYLKKINERMFKN